MPKTISAADSNPDQPSSTHAEQGHTQRPNRGIAIIGVSGRYPGGANSPSKLWETLTAGVDAVSEAKGDRWDLGWHHPDPQRDERVYTKAGGFLDRVDGFDADFFGISPREARQVDPQHRLLLELAWEAFEDASISPRSQAGCDVGVFIGISGNDYAYLVGPQAPDAYSNTGSSLSIAANRISYLFDLHGPSVALDTACSSSLVCVHQACNSLLRGECTTALAGGVNLLLNVRPWIGFAKASMLSPTGRCRSFAADGDGYVRSEGGGLVLLKPLDAAERDGDRILGVILASGVNSDGRSLGLSMPNGEAQERLLREVYQRSGVAPEEVVYVEAHGTGTSVGDPIECGALGRVLGESRTDGSNCLIGSVKSNIGHLEAASGIAGLTKVLLALKHREVPANLHFTNPNPKIDFKGLNLEVVSRSTPLPQREKPLVIGINSFGFGGTNAHVVLEEYKAAPVVQTTSAATEFQRVLILSAHTQVSLQDSVRDYIALLRSPEGKDWDVICAAAATCRSLHRHRIAISAPNSTVGAERLEQYLAGEPLRRAAVGVTPVVPPSVAFVYSGNGPQWWGMGRNLLAESPIFKAAIEATDTVFAPLSGWSLIEEMQRPEKETRISLTEYAQPLLFAEQIGLTWILLEAGVVPAAVLGHSVGEVAAAYASGALTLEQATKVIYYRSQEQSRTAGMGRMAALGVSATDVQSYLKDIPGWLEVAAINAPQAITVAGDPTALDLLVQALTAAGKFARMLPLNYPFHTKAMESIREPLLTDLVGLAPVATKVSFISTVDGLEKDGEGLDAEYWYRNIRETVRFGDAVNDLLERGTGVFLEIGPHPVLKDYVSQSAKSKGVEVVSLPTLRRPGSKTPDPASEVEDLWTAICACHAHGASKLDSVFTRPIPAPELPTYPWQKTHHWRGSIILPDVIQATHRDHPLLGYRMTSGDALWQNTLDTNQIQYLKDHVIQGAVLFPAAGHVELALAAAKQVFGDGEFEISNLAILQPLSIPDHGDPLIQISMDAKDGTFEIRSSPDLHSGEWTRQAQGRVSRVESSPLTKFSGSLDAAKMSESLQGEEHYAGTALRGLVYGPTFQGVTHLSLTDVDSGQREALANIDLSGVDFEAYRSHPGLLDSCLQVVVTLIGQNERRNCAIIPNHFGKIRSFAPLTSSLICRVTLRQESDRSAVADFQVMDKNGNLLLSMEEARCQKVDFQKSSTPWISSWWRPDWNYPSPDTLPALPSATEIVASLAPVFTILSSENARRDFYLQVRPRFDALVGTYAARALSQVIPIHASVIEEDLFSGIQATPEQMAALECIINIVVEEGALLEQNGTLRRNADFVPVSPDHLWREAFTEFPAYQTELQLMAEAGDRLTAMLRGEAEPEGESEKRSILLEQLYDTAPFQAHYNQMLRTYVETLVQSWPNDRPLRILEIGGGGGALTAWLLPTLPMDRTDYVFTESSESLLGRATHRLSAYGFVQFSSLSLEQGLVEQGMPKGYFDLVLGANALRKSEDVLILLHRLQEVMADDGQLVLIEAHKDRFTELISTLESSPTSSFIGASSSALHESADWTKSMTAAGFDECLKISDAESLPSGISPLQSLYFARRGAKSSSSESIESRASDSDEMRRWMIVVEEDHAKYSQDICDELLGAIRAHRHSATILSFVPGAGNLESVFVDTPARELPNSVVYISATSAAGAAGPTLIRTEKDRSLSVLQLLRALEGARHHQSIDLTLVTRGAFSTALDQGPVDPAQAPLWGLGRVISNEDPSVDCHMVDLHDSQGDPGSSAQWLASELLRQDEETEVQLVAGHRFVNRERLTTAADEARHSASMANQQSTAEQSFVVGSDNPGGLDTLSLRAMTRRAPAENEVEIRVHAAGLNFRDVLWTMGMLPEEAVESGFSGPTIGMECSGEIVRIGAGVVHLKVGDRVVAFASACFASHVTTNAGAVSVIPDDLRFAEAATIPTAFLTAYYALDHLARLASGESILIHGAAGGVGLAAIQIAKLKGAKIFGTAGSVRKRRMLKLLGVDHVLDSRSLDFANEVMRLTNGIGVDVVLNSLAGEAITKSLECLRPFGRFLEIGKRDLYANSRLGLRPFRKNLSYFGIDADTLLVERRDLAHLLLTAVLEHFSTGMLRPLPFQSIPVSRAAEAFRMMQQSKHIGKIVVSMDSDNTRLLPISRYKNIVNPNGTYVISGGLGGFGLATARWLVEQGATSLALLGRRGAASEEAITGLAELERLGAVVKAFSTDVADLQSVSNAVAQIRASMAPLTGVIHSAAVIEDAPVMQIDGEQLERVLSGKILGAWNLHEATLQDPIEMFALYSSSSTVVGNPGQGAYVAGNLYLDSLAEYRRSLGLPALAIGWGAIKDVGFLTRHSAVADHLKKRTGLDATPVSEALEELGKLIQIGATRVCVARFDLQRLSQMLPGTMVPRFLPILTQGSFGSLQIEETLASRIERYGESERRELVLACVRKNAAHILGIGSEELNTDRSLADLGLDSLMAVELAVALERDLEQPVSVMQLLSAGNIGAISELALKMLASRTSKDIAHSSTAEKHETIVEKHEAGQPVTVSL